MRKTICTVALLLSGLFIANANADTLIIDSAYQKPEMARPTKGQSKAKVEEKYGSPEVRNPAVGDPPISSWVYPEFTVYFEYDLVLHSVMKH